MSRYSIMLSTGGTLKLRVQHLIMPNAVAPATKHPWPLRLLLLLTLTLTVIFCLISLDVAGMVQSSFIHTRRWH